MIEFGGKIRDSWNRPVAVGGLKLSAIFGCPFKLNLTLFYKIKTGLKDHPMAESPNSSKDNAASNRFQVPACPIVEIAQRCCLTSIQVVSVASLESLF